MRALWDFAVQNARSVASARITLSMRLPGEVYDAKGMFSRIIVRLFHDL